MTLAFALRRNMGWVMAVSYWAVQFAAACGSLLARTFFGWKEIWRQRCPSLALMASRCLRGDHYLRLGAHGPQPGKRAGAKWALCPACPRRAHHGLRHNGWTIRRRVDEPSTKLRAGSCSGQPVDLVGLRRWTGGRRRGSPWCRSRAARAGRRGLRSNRMQQFKASYAASYAAGTPVRVASSLPRVARVVSKTAVLIQDWRGRDRNDPSVDIAKDPEHWF